AERKGDRRARHRRGVLERYAQIRPRLDGEAPRQPTPLELSFPHLHDFEGFPVRFPLRKVLGVPAPPDDLLHRAARAARSAALDMALLDAYRLQLRLYGVAARRGLLPGGESPRLVLFDLRRGVEIEVEADDAAVEFRVAEAVAKIEAKDFSLGPRHANRPCHLCAYRPICPQRRLAGDGKDSRP